MVVDYPQLVRQVADALFEASLYQRALEFYQPLELLPEQVDASLHVQMGKCYLGLKSNNQAEECFQTAIQVDDTEIEARMQLARLYEELNEQQQAFIFVNEVISLRRYKRPPATPPGLNAEELPEVQPLMSSTVPRALYMPRRLADPAERRKEEQARAEQLQTQYSIMRKEHDKMRAGNTTSLDLWMEAAKELIDDFRGFKTFYPWDKYVRFLGYTGDARLQAETALDTDLTAMADRLSQSPLPPPLLSE